MFKHYVSTAFRNFKRFRLTTSVNVLVLALGLACFIGARSVVMYFGMGDRHIPNYDRVYFVAETIALDRQSGGRMIETRTARKIAEQLRAQFPELERVARFSGSVARPAIVDGKAFDVETRAADREFLEIFPLPFVAGDAAAVAARPHSTLITEAAALRLFGNTAMVGQTLSLEGHDLVVDGVITFPRHPSHLGAGGSRLDSFDVLLLNGHSEVAVNDGPGTLFDLQSYPGFNVATYVRLPPSSLDVSAIESRLAAWNKETRQAISVTSTLLPITEFRRVALADAVERNIAGYTWSTLLMVTACVVLLVACFNYGNLAVAIAVSREKESSVRRVLGAGTTQFAIQFSVESLLSVACSALLAFVAIALLAPVAREALVVDFLYVWRHNARFWMEIAALLATVTMLMGVVPILIVARTRITDSLARLRGGRYATSARWFVGAQFLVISSLILLTLTTRLQHREMLQVARRSVPDSLIVIRNDLAKNKVTLETLRTELLREPHIQQVSATRYGPWSGTYGVSFAKSSPEPAASTVSIMVSQVDRGFLRTMRFHFLVGQSFDQFSDAAKNRENAGPTEIAPIVIDRSAARQFGWRNPQDAIGKQLYSGGATQGDSKSWTRVIGVVEDNTMQFTTRGVTANGYLINRNPASLPLVLPVKNHTTEALQEVDAVWRRLAPGTVLRAEFMNEVIEQAAQFSNPYASTIGWVTLCALLITLSGLVGMSVHIARDRTHEIGVRKALGAHVGQVVAILLRACLWPVAIGNLLAWPLAYLLMREYLNVYSHRIDITPTLFVAGLLIALGVAALAVGGQTWRAARLKPADVLRHE